jgi:hypothetical protein
VAQSVFRKRNGAPSAKPDLVGVFAPGEQEARCGYWSPEGGSGVYNDHAVDVRYDGEVRKWSVYNEDGARMPAGTSFNVAVWGAGEGAR